MAAWGRAWGRAWGWLRSWGGGPHPGQAPPKEQSPARGRWGAWWPWGGRPQEDPVEQYWEAQEAPQPPDAKEPVARAGVGAGVGAGPRTWWSWFLPTSYLWGRSVSPLGRQPEAGDGWGPDVDADYRTPPPSPPPSSRMSSPFRLFTHSWSVELHPQHYDICFNFLRHLFDLFVVGFLWTVSPPTKLLLELLGVQGGLRLWLHGMAMFVVSTCGMAGLLWLIHQYLPQFALIYGIIQAAVISVSVRQSVMLGDEGGALGDGGDEDTPPQADVSQRDAKKTL